MRNQKPAEAAYDVVVVGGRAAGAATALLLARRGLDVLLVDRQRHGIDTLSTHALMRGGVLQLSRWGLLDEVIAAGTPAIRHTTFRYAHDVVPIAIKPGNGVDALFAPRRTVLDAILVDAARAAGADVRFGIAVADVERDDRGAVTGVVGRARDGSTFQARARVVVGADGIYSTIADRVGAPYDKVGPVGSACTYGYWTGLAADGYEWNFRPDATSGVIPTNDGQTCVFAAATPERIGRGGMPVLGEILAESAPDLIPRLAAARPPDRLLTFKGRPSHLRRSWGPGWALVGDSGYFKDPLTSHGITDALRDAELLARAVADVLIHDADERDALAGYQATRDALADQMFGVAAEIGRHRWTNEEIPLLLLRLSGAAQDGLETIATFDAPVAA
ncbi:MAG TPA: FAD-dependent monooxygenase [Nocardioidaceae bacterium]|nr:FAD-dependent monooxygenase [Nocardioidaceae bacterium]